MAGVALKSQPSLSGVGSLVRYAEQPLKRFEDARSFSARATAYDLLGTYTQVIFDPELIESVLVGNHAAFSKDSFVRDLGAILGQGLLTSEGDQWRRQRKLAAPSFQRVEIASYGEQMLECTRRFLASLKEGEPFDAHAAFMHLTLEILVQALFGIEISRAREVSDAIDCSMLEYTPLRMALRVALPPWVSVLSRRRIARLRRALDSVLLELIAASKQRQGLGADLLSRLLAAGDAEGDFSDAQLRDQTMTLFIAGHETTALVLTYTLRLLALHPAVAERAQREVRSVLGGRSLTLADLPKLRFTRAVLDESMRLFPPAWGLTREAIADCELGEFECPAGTRVIIVPWVMHRDPRFFELPELFRPERWLAPLDLPRCVYMPFGAGPRVCIGNHFALTEALLVLASCLAVGTFHLAAGPRLRLAPAVTLRPRGPVNMWFKRG
jgi:cytochrome P450